MDNTIKRFVDLTDQSTNTLYDHDIEETREIVRRGDVEALSQVDGHFALAAMEGDTIRMARTIACPMRYFVAKLHNGPFMVVADRMDRIYEFCQEERIEWQFHPSYTRMVPAHYLVEIKQIGCPDPNPTYRRFFSPSNGCLPPDVQTIGRSYLGALYQEIRRWIASLPESEPVGVAFSGGADSASVFILAHHAMRELGLETNRLRAFTLAVGSSPDLEQARQVAEAAGFLDHLEVIAADEDDLDLERAIAVIEDYHPLDVQCAAALLALLSGIRRRYPEWNFIIDGDGGDENLKSYPLEDSNLTLASVLKNPLLYHEGWGIDAIKHSLTYSGGHSRAYVRTYAPLQHYGFKGFSPYTLRSVIAASLSIPFAELVDGNPERLAQLKGEVVQAGVAALTGIKLPALTKRRFQEGAASADIFSRRLACTKAQCQVIFEKCWDKKARETPLPQAVSSA